MTLQSSTKPARPSKRRQAGAAAAACGSGPAFTCRSPSTRCRASRRELLDREDDEVHLGERRRVPRRSTRSGADDRPRPHRADRRRGARVLAGGWMLVVSPERNGCQARHAGHRRAGPARERRKPARGRRAAQAQYRRPTPSWCSLGKAVPPSQEVPSLIYQLAQASNQQERRLHLDHLRCRRDSAGTPRARPRRAPPRRRGGRGGERRLHADAVHVRVRRQLLRSLHTSSSSSITSRCARPPVGCASAGACSRFRASSSLPRTARAPAPTTTPDCSPARSPRPPTCSPLVRPSPAARRPPVPPARRRRRLPPELQAPSLLRRWYR